MSESVNTMRFMGEAIAMITKAYPECNVITSKGMNATQSVFHLHVHIVPREANDGLMLPWTGQIIPPKTKSVNGVTNNHKKCII